MLLHSEMGLPEKNPEAMQCPVAGISPPRTPLRSINTRPSEDLEAAGCCSAVSTPTAKEARIPGQLPCPPPPRKRRPPLRCQRMSGGVEYFSCPPDLEAVFMRRPAKAK